MNALTPRFERMTGQVMLEGLPVGVAGEASVTPVPGLDLAFDRLDGRLCQAVVSVTGPDRCVFIGEQVTAFLIRLFGPNAPRVILHAAAATEEAPPGKCVLCPEPGIAEALSGLARLQSARATSPVSHRSPWWADEVAEYAERAGFVSLAHAQAGSGAAGWPPVPLLDVAAEVRGIQKDQAHPVGLHWMLDPALVPEGLFQFGLSPYSDLVVRHECGRGRIVVEAPLAPAADGVRLSGCRARLIDPAVRRVLAQASFTVASSRARAELRSAFPLDELPETWIEVVGDKGQPVRGRRPRRIRRALRWADAALRAERAPASLDPAATGEDWSALADAAWERCRADWAATGDADRAYLAASRRAARDSRARSPCAPSATAAEIARQVPLAGPACLAEVMG